MNISAKKRRLDNITTVDASADSLLSKCWEGCGCKYKCLNRLCGATDSDDTFNMNVVLQCQKELQGMDDKQIFDYIMQKIGGFERSVYDNKILISFRVPVWENRTVQSLIQVCPYTFEVCYNLSEHFMRRIRQNLKDGLLTIANRIDDRTAVDDVTYSLAKNKISRGTENPIERGGALRTFSNCQLPNTTRGMRVSSVHDDIITPTYYRNIQAIAWMEDYFQMTGDHIPNSQDEIHLESQTKEGIYKEYNDFAQYHFEDAPLCYSSFVRFGCY